MEETKNEIINKNVDTEELKEIPIDDINTPTQEPIDFHKKNLLYIEEIKRKKAEEALNFQIEIEREKIARQKLSILILKRAEKSRKLKEEKEQQEAKQTENVSAKKDNKTDKENKENKEETDTQEKSQLKGYYRSRHATFLKALSDQNKQKKEKEEEEKRKKELIQEKLKETLGVNNIQSKFLSTLPKKEFEEKKEIEPEKTPKKISEDDIKKTEKNKESALKLAQKQIEYIKQISDKRSEEKALKIAEDIKKEKAMQILKQKILSSHQSESKATDKANKPKKSFFFEGVNSMVEWRKKAKIPDTTKVFVISGGYGDISVALKKRGWVENRDLNSDCFDFKWTLKIKEIDFKNLKDSQIVNHFVKNTELTTKVGLCHNLRNLIWYNNVDIDTFYSRCFDMSDPNEVEDFTEEFKFLKAESILKRFASNNYIYDGIGEERVMISLNICEKRVIDLDEYIDKGVSDDMVLVSKEEWDLLSNDQMTSEALAHKKHEKWFVKIAKKLKIKIPKKKKITSKEEGTKVEEENQTPVEEIIKERVGKVLKELEAKYPQFSINGSNNIWIVKPASLSRGRGIGVFADLLEILDYTKGKEQQWICQKYIENPLILLNRKFDIRQWVIVTSFCPLKVWFYNKCYLRFGGEDYTKGNLENKYVHLTNNSVVKHCHTSAQTSYIEGNMWYSEDLQKYLLEKFGSDVYTERIVPQMQNIIIWSLQCVQDQVVQKKSCCEHFGYDFMIDENCNVWLIEVNSSPAMDYSTCITEDLVKEVSDDIIKVLVDYREASKENRSKIGTGNFTQIYKEKNILEKPLHSYGISLVCEGKKIK